MVTIPESKMLFGPFHEDDVFYIEKSRLYQDIGTNVQMAEFVLKKNGALIFVEAKTTAPNPNGITPERFPEYIAEISDKLHNSLDLLFSAKLKVAKDTKSEVVEFISVEDISNFNLAFRLVVKKAEKEWLKNIQEALESKLVATMNIWNIDVKVMNEEMARQRRLIS